MRNYKKITILFILLFSIFLLTTASISASDTDNLDNTNSSVQTVHATDKTSSVEIEDNKIISDNKNNVINKQVSDTKSDIKKDITKQNTSKSTKTLKTTQSQSTSDTQITKTNITNNNKNLKTAQQVSVSNYDDIKGYVYNTTDSELTITLNSGTYNITTPIVLNSSMSNVTKLTINGNGQKINGNSTRFLNIDSGRTVILNNLTITITNSTKTIINNGNLTINNTNFTNNTLKFTQNEEDNYGGFIFNNATLEVANSTFYNNTLTARDTDGYIHGGFIYNNDTSQLNIHNVNFTNSYIYASGTSSFVYGGFIYNNNSNLTLNGTIFNNTLIKANGTGGYVYGGLLYNTGLININYSIIRNYTLNVSGARSYMYGGMFYNEENSTLLMNNYTITTISTSLTETLIKATGVTIYNDGVLNLTNGSLNTNRLTIIGTNTTITGATIYNSGNTTLFNTSFNGLNSDLKIANSTIHGGILYNNVTGILNIMNNTFNNNIIGSSEISAYNSYTYGGVIYNRNLFLSDGEYKLENNTFSNNKAYYAGVIYHDHNSNITLYHNTFSSNEALDNGGVFIANNYNITIINSTFTNNKANKTTGGVINSTTLTNITIIDSIFKNNSATTNGGVIYTTALNNGSIIIFNSNFTNNSISGNKGGVIYYTSSNSSMIIVNSLFEDNKIVNVTSYTSQYGGAIYYSGNNNTLNVSNSIFYKNWIITYGTINTNSYYYGGAIYFSSNYGLVNINNSNFTRNGLSNYQNNQRNSLYNWGYGGALYFSCSYTNFSVINNYFTINFVEICSMYGGSMQRRYGGAIYHVGVNCTFNITNNNFTNNLVYHAGSGGAVYHSGSYCTFIITNNIFNHNNLYEFYGEYGGAIYTEGFQCISNVINNTFINNIIGSGSGGAIYHTGNNYTLQILSNNFINNTASSRGGAIFCNGDNGTFIVLSNNFINNTADYMGGAIFYSGNSNYIINNSNFINNTVDYASGGSIYNYNGILKIFNSTFTDNKITQGISSNSSYGGAIYKNQGTLNINNSTFTNNQVIKKYYSSNNNLVGGGAIYVCYVITIINNVNFINNSLNYSCIDGYAYGGAIHSYFSSLTVQNTLFTDNNITTNGYAYGGAIFKSRGTQSIYNTNFTNNKITKMGTNSSQRIGGAAVGIYDATTLVSNINFIDNTINSTYSSGTGGVIVNEVGTLTIKDSTFINNSVITYGNGSGGSIHNDFGGTININNTNFTNNKVMKIGTNSTFTLQGGAITNTYISVLTVNNTKFINNSLNSEGGAYANGGAISNTNQLTLYNIEFKNNQVNSTKYNATGGAISTTGVLNACNTVFINNNVVTINSSSLGGALSVDNITNGRYTLILNLNNSKFINNTVESIGLNTKSLGGAIYGGVYYSGVVTSNVKYEYNITINKTIFDNNSVISRGNDSIASAGVIFGEVYINRINYPDSSKYDDKLKYNLNVINSSFNNNSVQSYGNNTKSSGGAIVILSNYSGFLDGINNTRNYTTIVNISNSNFINNSVFVKGANGLNRAGTIYIESNFSGSTSSSTENVVTCIRNYTNNITLNNNNITNSKVISLGKNITNIGGAIGYTSKYDVENSTTQSIYYHININNTNITNSILTVNDSSKNSYAGAIFIDGNMTITNSLINNNSADYAGAIYVNGNLTIENTTFNHNNATYGGVFYNNATFNLTSNTNVFTKNVAEYGGIIYNVGNLTLNNTTFTSSNATKMGGVIYNTGVATINNATFNNNSAQINGGVVYNTGNTTITNSKLNSNTASNGGLLYTTANSNTTLTGSHLENNTVTGSNSFIVYNEGMFTATNNVFENNSNADREDVLFLHDSNGLNENTYASDNTYNNNSLHTDTVIGVPLETETGILFNITTTLYPVYNDTVRDGNISLGLNKEIYGNYTIKNSLTTVEIPYTNLTYSNTLDANYTAYDLSYQDSDDTYSFTKIDTYLVIDTAESVDIDEQTVVNVTIYDVVDRPIKNVNITVIVNGNQELNITNVTDENGRIYVTLNSTYFVAGVNNITAVFNGTRLYVNCTNDTTLLVNKIYQNITAKVVNQYVASTSIELNVTDFKTNKPLANTSVNVTLENGTVVKGITNENGTVVLDIPTVINGTLNVLLSANETSTHYNTSSPFTIDVLKRPTALANIELVNATTTDVTAIVTLMDLTNGKDVLNGTVTVYELVNGVRNATVGTSVITNGSADINVLIPLTPGELHDFEVVYEGDDWYLPVDDLRSTYVDKLYSIITPTNVTNTVYTNIPITATISDSRNEIIKSGNIRVEVEDQIFNTTITDGKIEFNYTFDSVGSNKKIILYYDGDVEHQSTIGIINVTIIPRNTTTQAQVNNGQINIEVHDTDNNLIRSNATVIVREGGNVVGMGVLTNGITNITANLIGTHNLSVEYIGDSNYNPSNTTVIWSSNKVNTEIGIDSITTLVNKTVNVTGTVTGSDGNVINGKVNITIDGVLYTVDVANGKFTQNYTPATKGIKQVVVNYLGNDTHNPSQNSTIVTVNTIDTILSLNSTDQIKVNTPTTINLTLKDANGNILNNTNISLTIDGKTTTIQTDSNGQISYTYTPDASGIKTIQATYMGSDVYSQATNSSMLVVNKLDTSLTITNSDEINVNDTTTIKVVLKDENGNLLSNKLINLTIGNQSYSLTTKDGEATYTYNPQNDGAKTIIARYDGDNVYSSVTNTSNINVNKLGTIITIDQIDDAKINHNSTINVTLTDENGNKLANQYILLTIGDISTRLRTDTNGTVRYNYTTDKESIINILAVFDETNVYEYSTQTGSYHVNKINTNITNIITSTGSVGNSSINMTLVDEFGNIVPNAEIIIRYDNGTIIKTGTTDSNGKLNTTLDLAGGSYNLILEYNGNQTYNETSSTATIGVDKLPSELVITKGGNRVGNTTLYFKLTDKTSGNPIAYSNVTLYNTTSREIIGTYITDDNGMIELPIFLLKGNHTFTAIYNGSSTYENTTSTLEYEVLRVPTRTTREIVHRFIDGFAINATVLPDTDAYGNLTIRNGTVNVYIQGNSTPVATGELVDGSVMLYPKIDNPGTYNLTISYMGNDYYQESGLTLEYTLDKAPTAILPQRQGDYVGNTTVTAILKDNENNRLLANATVKVEVDGVNVANVTTDENGTINLKLNLTAGDHSINFVYDGNDTYRGANNTISYPVIKIPVIFNQTRATNTSIDNSTILVEILDDRTKTPVQNGTVVIYDTDSSTPQKIGEGTITPSDNGTIEIKTNIQLEGNHNLVIVYEGNDYYQARNTTLIFETDKISTHLRNDKVGHYVGNTTLNITLQDVNNNLIPNAIVKIINRTSQNIIATGYTDYNGNVLVDVNLPAGSHPLEIQYDGDSTYTATSVNLTYDVDKIPTTTTRNVTYRFAEDFTINVTVSTDASDLEKAPVQNGTVRIYLNDTGEFVGEGEVNNGSVLIKTTYQELGKHTFNIFYLGNDYYLNSSTVLEDVDIVTIPTALTPIKNGTYVGNTSLTINLREHTLTDLDEVLPYSIINVYENDTLIATGLTDENGNVTFKLNLTAGDHDLVIKYDGDSTHRDISQELPYDVLKRPTAIVGLETLNTTVGNATIKVTVNDTTLPTHTPVQNGTVKISFYNGTQIGEGTVTDGVAIVKVNITDSGKYSLVVNYTENDYYQSTRITQPDMSFTDRTQTITITVINNTVGNTTIEINLTDNETGVPLPNTNVTVTLPNGTTVNGTTGDDGLVNITIPTNTSGEITVNVTSHGDDVYAPIDTNQTIDVTKRPTNTTATIITTAVSNNTINVKVIDAYTQTPVIKGAVTIYYGGVQVGYGQLTNGEANILTSLTNKGAYNLTAVYIENDYYYSSNDTANITIKGKPQNITITVVNNTIGNTTVEVNVTDNITGEPLPNTPVNITLPDGTIVNGTTNDEGLVNITIPTYNNQTIPINVTVPDTPVYDNATINSSVTPEKRPSQTSYEVVNDKVGETTLNITVTDKTTGENVPNGTVTIKDKDGNEIGTGEVTDGKTTVVLDELPVGDNPIVIEYGGNEVYNPSENDTTIPVVKKDVVITPTVVNETIGNTTIEINVTDVNGTPIPDMPVNVTLPNGTVVNGTTDENGTVNITIPTNGTNPIDVNITTPETPEYNNGTNSTEVTPEKRPSAVTPEILDNTVGETKLDVTVTDKETGDLVPNGTVTVKDSEGNPVGNGTVNNGKVIIDVDLPAGNHTVTIEYGGNEVYYPSAANTTIEIIKKDVVINATIVNETIGNTTIEINVTDVNGTPIPDMPVNVTLPNGTVVNGTTNENGTVNITIPTNGTNPFDVNITTPETPEYNNGTNSTEVTPEKRPSAITPEILDNTVGETKLDVTVTDATTGALIPNGTVTVKDANGKQVGNGTVNNGKVIIDVDLPAGNHTVTVEYGGNEIYYPSANTTKLEIIKKDVVIIPTVVNDTIGNTTVEVNVTDGNGTPIPDMPINITLPNGTVINGTTNENGTVNITIPTNSTDPIDVNITTPETPEYNNGTNTTDITPEKRPSQTSPEVIDNIVGEAKLDITVSDAINGTIIQNATVILKDSNGTPIGVGITDANGKVIINVDLPAGNHTVTVEFIGNDLYYSSVNNTRIEIIKKNVVINATVVNETIGNTTVEVNVTDGNGTPIPDMPINITLPNGTVINGTTNENGTVNITIPTNDTKPIDVNITTPETDEYNNGTNTTDITPEKRPSQTSPEVIDNTVGETKLDVTVTDATTGELIPNGTVTVKDSEGNPVGNGTVNNGKVIIDVNLPAGNHTVTVEYGGNEVYYPSANTTKLEIIKKDVVIIPTVVNDTIGNTTVEVNVTDGNGTPIPDMPINITLPNGTVINGTTNENGTVNITIPTNDTKPIDVNITTPETPEYNKGTNTTDINPEKLPSMTSPEVIDNTVGKTKLDITVSDAINGTIIQNATVIVKNSNGTPIGVGITDANGKVIINVDLPAGNHTVTVEFIGNDLYYSSVNNTRIEILKKDVVINTTVVNETIGNTTVEVNVTDGNGTPIPDMPINITIPNGTVINGTTDENGTVNITIPTNGTDPIDVNITTPETDEYNNGTNTTDITPEKRDSTITPEVIDNTVGETKLDVTVTDATTGDLVPNGTVTVKDSEGNPIGNGTVVDGKVIIDVDLPAGNHTVTVEYGGNEVYNPSVNITQIEIIKKDVVINTTIINETVGNTTVEVNVTDGNGTPIPDMPINITLPNGTVINGTTNENGTVNITIPTVNNETIPINITTPETDEYNNGTNTTEVTPEKIGVRVTLPNYEMYVLDYSNITVNVTDEYGNPVNGGYIIFKVNGKTLQANGKFSVTGRNPMKINVYNGKATIVFNATSFYKSGGINTMLVKYSGSSKYNQNASSIQKLTIKKRIGYVEVTTDKTEYKLYETVNIKATYYDITHGNKTAIYSDNTTYAVYKINGITSNYNNTNERYAITNSTATVGTDSQSKLNYIQYNYTAPGPNTVNSTVTIKTHNEYYNALTNTTTFKIVPSPMNINITGVTFNKTSNKVTITADLKDYMNNTVSGTNNYCVKINGITYYGNSTGGHIFQVENGKIKITINSTTTNIRNIELVTGQRYAYAGNRTTTTNIKVVY